MTPLQAAKAECAKPLQDFAQTVTKARRAFDANRSMAAWLVFYEAKQAAYAKLVAALPQVADIEDFWRYVQNMSAATWLPMLEREADRISQSARKCRDCAAPVVWPGRRCISCRLVRRRRICQLAQERARIKQRMRKCPACRVAPLLPRRRKCAPCLKASRARRKQRYKKSLKDGSGVRVQPKFTREEMSSSSQNSIKKAGPSTR